MKILIFTEGTIVMHKTGIGLGRKKVVWQVENEQPSVHDYSSYVPIKNAPKKIKKWKDLGAEIIYLTSRKNKKEVKDIKKVLEKYNFPKGKLLFRRENEEYKDVAERVMPDILIEDDCESIGGIEEMTITHIKPIIKDKIKSIPVKEFGGIDYLPDTILELKEF